MPKLNDEDLPTLFDIVRDWLEKDARTNWDYAATRTNTIMQGSIWIAHYVVIHVYDAHVIVIYPYHSMCCNSVTIQASKPEFFTDLYNILTKATRDL